jgi:hypothetical protein
MQRSRLRTGCIVVLVVLSLLAIARAGIPDGLSVLIAVPVLVLAIREGRRPSGRHRIDRIDGGRIRLQTPGGRCLHGALEPSYCSGLYCAFTIHDPTAGSQRFGLFRDELDVDAWRRLRVALRTGKRSD